MYSVRSPHLTAGPPPRLNRSSLSTEYSETSSFVSTVPSTASSVVGEFSVLCLHDYDPTDQDQLGFRKGDILAILKTLDTGWWAAAMGNTIGWVPRGYVEPISDAMADTLKTVRRDLRATSDQWDPSKGSRPTSIDQARLNGNGEPWAQRRGSAASSNTQSSDSLGGNARTYQAPNGFPNPTRSPPLSSSGHQQSNGTGGFYPDYSHAHSSSTSSVPGPSSSSSRTRAVGPGSSSDPHLPSPGPQGRSLSRSQSAYNSPRQTPSSMEFGFPPSPPPVSDTSRVMGKRSSRDDDAAAYKNAKSAMAALPPYLKPQYGEGYLRLDSEGVVKSGTLEALVERLTVDPLKRSQETAFRTTFLMTYRTFTDALTIFELLTERYLMDHPPELTEEEFNEWREKRLRPTQTRVLATLTEWVERYRFVKDESHMVERLKEFLELIKTPTKNALTAKLLLQTIEKQEAVIAAKALALAAASSPTDSTQPAAPTKRSLLGSALTSKSRASKNELLKIDPLELAQHLTLVEYRLYAKVRPYECMTWPKTQRGSEVENLVKFCSTSDRLVAWVKYSILNTEGLGKRADVIEHWIKVAEKCRSLNNISSMSALVAALASTVIIRLQLTWGHVGRASHMEPLTRLTDPSGNFAAYRSFYSTVDTSCVPFIGLYLTGLTHYADQYDEILHVPAPTSLPHSPASVGTPSPSTSTSFSPHSPNRHQHHQHQRSGVTTIPHINFTRLFKCAEVIHQMLRHQTKGYRQANASASATHPVPDPHNAATISLGVENASVMAFVEGMLATGGVGPTPPPGLQMAEAGGGNMIGLGPVGVAETYYWQRSSELQTIEAETSDIRKGLEAAGF